MTEKAKIVIDTIPTLAYWSACGGIEVKDVREKYGETYIRCISNAWQGRRGRRNYHNLKVFYTNPTIKEPRAYIVIKGRRYYIDECLRT